MAITDASAAARTVSASTSSATTSRGSFDEQYSTFLQLLTTQLQNQNPVEPMNTNEFTQQVVSYSALEQQINTNTQLDKLVSLISSFLSGNAISYVGDIVTFSGAEAELAGGSAEWSYDVARTGLEGTIEIRDAAGRIVRTDTPDVAAGRHTYTWDGRTDDNKTAPDGDYSISVVVRDASDVAISVDTSVAGRVDAVDLTGATPQLVIGGRTIPISDVMTVRASN